MSTFIKGMWYNSKMITDRDFYLFVWGQLVGLTLALTIYVIWTVR
jgi:hypothetical protein